MRQDPRQRGIVLVLALWAGALLGVIAASFAFGVRSDNASVVNAGARLQAGALAESAINRALLGLLGTHRSGRWQDYGRVYETPFEGGTLRARIQAETGKIDLNAAPDVLLQGVVEAACDGLEGPPVDTVALTAALLDWRDADARVRPFGAEDPEYRAAGLDHGAGDRPFVSVDELSQVLGMSGRLLERLQSVVTVHTRSPRIDPMAASRLALLAVPGLDPGQIDAFLSERDRWLDQDPVRPGETTRPPMHLLAEARHHFSSTQTRVYTILAEGRTGDGVAAFRQAVVQTDSGSQHAYRLLAWASEPVAVEPVGREPAP